MNGHDHRTDEQREIDRLKAALARATAERDQYKADAEKATREAGHYRQRAAAAEVNAGRAVRRELGRLSRVLAELIRRNVATDLVPDWWRSINGHDVADAEMRAGWPEPLALADRCRQLEEALHRAGEREDEAHRRVREAERSRDEWIDIAVAAGAVLGRTSTLAQIPTRARHRDLDSALTAFRATTDRLEARTCAAEGRYQRLAAYVRRLTRLPVPVKKLLSQGGLAELYALADAVAPANGGPCSLPPDIVSEICRVAAEHTLANHLAHAEILGKRANADRLHAAALAHYGYPAKTPAASQDENGQGDLLALAETP